MVRLVGLEPTEPGFLARYGCQLHHKREIFSGMPPGIRTQNIRFLKPTRLPIAAGALKRMVREVGLEPTGP